MHSTMMMRLAIAALCLLCISASGAGRHERGRSVSVSVQFIEPGGRPIPDVPVQARTSLGDWFARSDAEGVATIGAMLAGGEERVAITITPRRSDEQDPAFDFEMEREHWRRIMKAHAFQPPYDADFSDGASSSKLVIVAAPAVEISGRLVDERGQPVERAAVSVRGAVNVARTDADGRFEIGGAALGREGFLGIVASGFACRIVRTPAAEGDADIGEVQLSAPAGEVDARITALRDWAGAAPRGVGGGVTLIAADGSQILTFRAAPEGQSHDARMSARIPQGEYFVLPGLLGATEAHFAAFEAISRGVDLRALGVPTIRAERGREAELSFSAKAAFEGAKRAAEAR